MGRKGQLDLKHQAVRMYVTRKYCRETMAVGESVLQGIKLFLKRAQCTYSCAVHECTLRSYNAVDFV